ncbi:MAG: hypothetical protein NTW75_13445 [Planctomycetales bacterium]|nr:hypothetical protein [Planctomycetales bacterium]
MQADCIDLYDLHAPDPRTSVMESAETLQNLFDA